MGREEQEVQEEKCETKKINLFNFLKSLSKSIKSIIILVALAVILALVLVKVLNKEEPVKEVITVSTLEKIVEVSELSTFKVVYNGVAEAEGRYYVSYEATVDAGIEFENIDISVDNETKLVKIDIPQAEILDVYVDIASLDYIFIDKKANNETVSEEAFKLCKYDVMQESKNQEAIIELAQQNAENIVRALVTPFVEQVDAEYEIVIE